MVGILNVTYNITGKQLHSLRGFAEMVINFASYTAVLVSSRNAPPVVSRGDTKNGLLACDISIRLCSHYFYIR